MSSVSIKKLLILGVITVIFAAIPLTMYLLSRQSKTNINAIAATTLSFNPASSTAKVGDTVPLSVILDPGGTNQVSFVKLIINYDATKLKVPDNGLIVGTATPSATNKPLTSVLEGPTIDNTKGTASITVSAGADPTQIITKPTTIATISFQVLTASGVPIQITFAPAPQTQVLSAGSDATSSENVLSSAVPATITTTAATTTPIPPTTITVTPLPTGSGGGTGLPPGGGTGGGLPPICTALNTDRQATGSVPLSLTFTAIGNTPTGTISKVTFNFGDGPVQDVTQGGGIGSATLTGVQLGHTYTNPGTFTASAIITNSSGGTSDPATCTQSITLTPGTTTGGGGAPVAVATQPPTAIPTQIVPTKKPPVSGPGDTILGVGAIGVVLSTIGAALILLL